MKISISDIETVLLLAKRIKPKYARFHHRKGKMYLFLQQDMCLMGYEFNIAEDVKTFDITVEAGALLTCLSNIPKNIASVTVEAPNNSVSINYTKSKTLLANMAQEVDELISGLDSLFKLDGEEHDILPIIGESWKYFAITNSSAFGWQLGISNGEEVCGMTDRTIASLYWTGESSKEKDCIFVTIPEIAGDFLSQIYKAYEIRAKKSKNDMPMIYVAKNMVGFPFTDQVAFRTAVQGHAESNLDLHKLVQIARAEKIHYTTTAESLKNILKSVEGFKGGYVEVNCSDKLMMNFNSASVKHNKQAAKAHKDDYKDVDGIKFTVSYTGLKSIVSCCEGSLDISINKVNDRAQSFVINGDKTSFVIVCGV